MPPQDWHLLSPSACMCCGLHSPCAIVPIPNLPENLLNTVPAHSDCIACSILRHTCLHSSLKDLWNQRTLLLDFAWRMLPMGTKMWSILRKALSGPYADSLCMHAALCRACGLRACPCTASLEMSGTGRRCRRSCRAQRRLAGWTSWLPMQVTHTAALCLPAHLPGQVNVRSGWSRELSLLQSASLLGCGQVLSRTQTSAAQARRRCCTE